MTIGKRISEERRKKNLSQEYVAEKLGVSRQAVSKWEMGQSAPDTNNLIALAELLDVSIEYLATGNLPEPEPPKNKKETGTAKIAGFILLGVGLLSLVLGVLFSEVLLFLSLYMILISVLCITIKKYLWIVLSVTLALPVLLYVSVFMVRTNVQEIIISTDPNGVAATAAVGSPFSVLILFLIGIVITVCAVIFIPKMIKRRKK